MPTAHDYIENGREYLNHLEATLIGDAGEVHSAFMDEWDQRDQPKLSAVSAM